MVRENYKMYTLGVSCYFHDSSVAVLRDGELIFFILEDRFSRKKHDSSYPESAIEYVHKTILNSEKLSSEDRVIYYEDNELKFLNILSEALEKYPFQWRGFFKAIPMWIFEKFWVKSKLAMSFSIPLKQVQMGDHHLSHAAYGYYASGFKESLVLCSDGFGDRASLSLYHFEGQDHEKFLSFDKKKSLGLIYTTFTTFFGFKANDGECSLMAISRFGKPIYKDKITKALRLDRNHIYTVEDRFFNFDLDSECFYTSEFLKEFGKPFKGKYTVSCFENVICSEGEQYYLDLAASFHEVFEEVYIQIFKEAFAKKGIRNFVFSGGVAQNCVLIAKLNELDFVDEIFVPLDPGDGGTAIGAAALAYVEKTGRYPNINQTFAGANIKLNQRILESMPTLSACQLDSVQKAANVFDVLFQNEKVVAVFQDKMEVGPRALGNRSLLCRADHAEMVRTLSEDIKTRAYFRPYALIVLEEDAEVIVDDFKLNEQVMRMQTVVKIKEQYHRILKYGLHIDGTTRIQVINEKSDPFLYSLLLKVKEKIGIGALINTSFNESGFPLIHSPVDALYFFKSRPLGALVINDTWLTKVGD